MKKEPLREVEDSPPASLVDLNIKTEKFFRTAVGVQAYARDMTHREFIQEAVRYYCENQPVDLSCFEFHSKSA